MAGFRPPTFQAFTSPCQLPGNDFRIGNFGTESLMMIPNAFGGFTTEHFRPLTPETLDTRVFVGGNGELPQIAFGCSLPLSPGPIDFFSNGIDRDKSMDSDNEFERDFRDRRRESIREMRREKREQQLEGKRRTQFFRYMNS